MFGLGTEELVLILIIVLVLFGASRLPQLAKGLGQSVRELRKGFTGDPNIETDDKENKKQQENPEKKA